MIIMIIIMMIKYFSSINLYRRSELGRFETNFGGNFTLVVSEVSDAW